MAEPRIVFTTTCKGRLQHLCQTLPKNIIDNADYPNAKFVVLDYGDQGGLDSYLRSAHAADIQSGKLAVYRFETTEPFHVAHAKNIAARCGILEGADILVTLDADNYTGPGFARFIADKFRDYRDRGVWGFFLCPNYVLIQSLPHGPSRPQRGYAGRLAIRAQDFVKMGGYDETFSTWRGEDIDLVCRLRRLGYAMRHIDNRYLNTIAHSGDVRFKEYPEARQYERKEEFKIIDSRTETVVNYGKFGLGSVYRDFAPEPIELAPVPTRIFGIGMHRTATTSLHAAFQILGFDSFHWGEGEAPLIWDEMTSLGRSKTLERWYALSDLPIPLLYQKLDQVYPGSKFILTVRNEDDWLKSVERLWSYEYNPTRHLWDVYPFSNRIHTELYGQQTFDAAVFLDRYRRHNAEVREYFRQRPDDLLVMDIDAGSKWRNLCGFLAVPTPTVPYPNQTPSTFKDDWLWGSGEDHPHFMPTYALEEKPIPLLFTPPLPAPAKHPTPTSLTRNPVFWKLSCAVLAFVILWLITLILLARKG